MTRRVVVLERLVPTAPMTTNRFLEHPHGRGAEAAQRMLGKAHRDWDVIEEWKTWAWAEAKRRHIPPFTRPVTVEIKALRKRRGRIDVEAPLILGKAMKDGLTLAKLWPDDDDTRVVGMLLLPHEMAASYGVRLTIREV